MIEREGLFRMRHGVATLRKGRATLVILLLVVLTAAACGQRGATTQQVTLYLDWSIDGLHAPFFVALKKGWYEEAGLKVDIQPGQGSADAVKVVGSGKAQFGYADAATMSKGASGGAPVKMVAVLIRKTPAVFLCRRGSGISTIKDLLGKSIGDAPQTATATLLPAVLEANGSKMTDIKFVAMTFGARVPSVLEGKVDCALGYLQEFVMIRDKVDFLPYYRFGINSYSSGIMVNKDFLQKNPDVVRKFVQASLRGHEFVLKNQKEAAEITASYSKEPQNNAGYFAGELEVLEPHFSDDEVTTNGYGWMSDERWKITQELMMKYGGQEKALPLADLYTNEFLRK
jgi:NitT/TauT family transport system substrate-binding protein